MNKTDILTQAFKNSVEEFENYNNNLVNKSLLIMYKNIVSNEFDYITVEFTGANYYHLTGLLYKDDNQDKTGKYGSRFYAEAKNKKLSISNFKIKDRNTMLKTKALPSISKIWNCSKMIGDYNNNGLELKLDKLIGGNTVCLGLKHIEDKKYAPASSLYNNTRNYLKTINQIIAIFIKDNSDAVYKTIKYVAKGVDLKNIKYFNDLKAIVSLDDYKTKAEQE